MAKSSSAQPTVGEIAAVLDSMAPPSMAQSWDNVGLLAGDPAAPCSRILLCIDLTPAVLGEAMAGPFQMILAYHPPIFKPITRLLADSGQTDALVHRAIAAGIAVYSPHTALDAAPGGTNDIIAGMCDLTEVEPFEYTAAESGQCKVVTFVPAEQVDAVAVAMAAAGAGRIGGYELCSYRVPGQGTFFGTEGTQPKVGRGGRLEKVPEVRIEMVAPRRELPEVINALLRTHPYEEPAYDVYPLAGTPSFGIGRTGVLPPGTTLAKLADRLRAKTGSKVLMLAGTGAARLKRAAVCVGAAGSLPLDKPRSAGCDVVVTGEIRHHEALTLLRQGKTAIALGHWESERPVLSSLADRLNRSIRGVEARVSRKDVGPFQPHRAEKKPRT